MNIDYKETSRDLLARIDIHQQYGSKDIDKWMLSILGNKKGLSILDIGCGSGKQCALMHDKLGENCKIIGGDVSSELLDAAKKRKNIKYMKLDFNDPLPFPDHQFDLVTCCFAIYYAKDIERTVREIHRVLKPGGSLFTTGPMPNNKKSFYDIIHEATNKKIPRMPGSSRYSTEILTSIKRFFNDVEVHIFENPLIFEQAEPFMIYVRASLSEDRRLWDEFFVNGFEPVIEAIDNTAKSRIAKFGKIVMVKVVGGFVATKS